MEKDSTQTMFDAHDIKAVGGSTLAAQVYTCDYEGRHSVRDEIEDGPFSLGVLSENPSLGGHFFAAVWDGDFDRAYARADGSNRQILDEVKGSFLTG